MRIAIAVKGQGGLDCSDSTSLETAERWVIAELSSSAVLGIDAVGNPLEPDGSASGALAALSVDVVIATTAAAAATDTLVAHGVRVITGASGTARKSLVDYVVGALDGDHAPGGHAHAH